jgi:Cu-processing system ATP-binding protein
MILKIEKINKTFGKLPVLNDVNLSIADTGCIAFIGPNASGKTTLIKSVLGLVIPDNGKISVNDFDIKNNFEYREHIGYMPQIGRYPENVTIENLYKMLITIRRKTMSECDTELIKRFDIETIFKKKLGTLSGGTRQKISACIAFLFHPEILILDEPTAGLDPVSCEILKEKIIREKKNGKLIIITSHILSDLDELVDEIVFMQEGKILFQKKIDELRTETGESRLSKAIAKIMGYKGNE